LGDRRGGAIYPHPFFGGGARGDSFLPAIKKSKTPLCDRRERKEGKGILPNLTPNCKGGDFLAMRERGDVVPT